MVGRSFIPRIEDHQPQPTQDPVRKISKILSRPTFARSLVAESLGSYLLGEEEVGHVALTSRVLERQREAPVLLHRVHVGRAPVRYQVHVAEFCRPVLSTW